MVYGSAQGKLVERNAVWLGMERERNRRSSDQSVSSPINVNTKIFCGHLATESSFQLSLAVHWAAQSRKQANRAWLWPAGLILPIRNLLGSQLTQTSQNNYKECCVLQAHLKEAFFEYPNIDAFEKLDTIFSIAKSTIPDFEKAQAWLLFIHSLNASDDDHQKYDVENRF